MHLRTRLQIVGLLGWLGVTLGQLLVAQEPQSEVERPLLPPDTLGELQILEAPPTGFSTLPATPADNPLSLAKAELGRKLFFDPILSADGTVACASCHLPEFGLATDTRFGVGIRGQKTKRNAPSLFNVGHGKSFFWDGRAATLEEQALIPITSPQELGSDLESVIGRLRQHPDYPRLFVQAFGVATDSEINSGITAGNLARAIASFERALLRGNSAVDRFHAAEYGALNAAARQGSDMVFS